MSDKKKVFSGIQPTGDIHIGNYLGALRNWVKLQDTYDAIYCVVDLHAITVPYDPVALRRSRLNTAKLLLAVGVDPSRSLLYFQSQVPQHAELSWMLSTITSLGALNRMTQFKEKADKAGKNLGLFAYPVLMAADILVHKAHAVPVGDDQTQHLELARDLAERFNSRFGDEFPVPEQITPEIGARVMSLKNPTSKMSKSDEDVNTRVLLLDEPDIIRKRFKAAVTDSESEVRYDQEKKPGVSNLLDILSLFTTRSIEDLVAEYHETPYGHFKMTVAEAVVEGLSPVRSAFKAFDDEEVTRIMVKGALDARTRAEGEMASVRKKLGFDARLGDGA
ncbi:MAG: tryptophan--tRNA ligase [Acidimicrobiia bacterium]|nr:tryptophan--tRNA ligase [Acidimicrobiia bacterium]MDH3396418.1 tryptophan--tRNA ligase [Acidimicrobiia bacterium]MDH5615455.1 tryptophan--tRNA ligase [Acidimicrobiia bacterium]